jgi:hypothetical protein
MRAPNASIPLIDVRTGLVTKEWYLYLITPPAAISTPGGTVEDGDKGDISVISGAWTIDNGVVTLAKLSNVSSGTVFYRKTAGSGVPEVQTLSTLKSDLWLTGTNSGDQDISGKEDKSNKVSTWSSPTTNTNYPSEKLVKDSFIEIEPAAFFPATMTVNAGTLDAGAVGDLAALGGTDVAISEVSGATPLQVTFTFTGVTKLSGVVFYGYYSGGSGHQITVGLWNYNTSSWDQVGVVGSETAKRWYAFPVYSTSSYMSAGAAQVRLNHPQSGVVTHDLYLDYLEIFYGNIGGISSVSAGSVVFTPIGNLSSTNVGAALYELDQEKQASGNYEGTTNKVTSISGASTDVQYPSAKLVYDQLAGKQAAGSYAASSHTHAPGDVTGTAVITTDSRLSDARTPTAHNQAESTITFTDIATGNVSASAHGFFPKLPSATGKFLRDDLSWQAVSGTGDVVGDDTSTTAQNIVAYSGVGGKNVTELTGTQGDVLYHNGTSWTKLAAGTDGWFLRSGGAGANPKWWPAAIYNQSTADHGAGFAADTYITGSSILVPSGALKVGTRYYCMARMTKTAAGTANPIVNIRFGTGESTSDTSRGTLTWTAGTAAIDDGILEIFMTVTTSGASGVIRTVGRITHKLSVTGLTGTAAVSETEVATSGAFDQTVSNSYIGLSLNAGASAAWTLQMVQTKLENLA